MAVIKIVPMPGAEGQKGDPGETGAQGPQGPIGATGPAGADAAWYYNGAYNPGASYVVGDVVTYEGQTWYRKHANGGNVGDTPSVGQFWDLVASKGTDASSFIGSGTWETNIPLRSGIVGGVSPTTDSLGRYYSIGDLVFIEVHFAVTQPESWGDSFVGELPFKIAGPWQEGIAHSNMRHRLKGQMILRGDAEPFGSPYTDNEENFIPVDIVLVPNLTENPDTFIITAESESPALNTNVNSADIVSSTWPVNLEVPNSTNSPYMSLRFSGVYRRA